MKKVFILLVLACLAAVSCCSPAEEQGLHPESDGPDFNEMEPYRCCAGEQTPAPRGYELFYLSHYGRHGSRIAAEEKLVRPLLRAMQWGHQAQVLTPRGDSLYNDLMKVMSMAEGRFGHLTQKGVEQLKGIAERANERYPEILDGKNSIRCLSSVYPRCIMSMTSFTNTLAALNPDLEISIDTGDRYMKSINGFGTSEMRPLANRIVSALRNPADSVAQIARLFSDAELARRNIPDYSAFFQSLYMTASMTPGLEEQVDLVRYLPEDWYRYWWDRRNRYAYLVTCNSHELGYKRMPMLAEAVELIVRQADEAVAGSGAPSADFRFGHDFALLTLMNHLNLAFLPQNLSMDQVPGRFRASDYISKASNIQIPFYRNAEGDVIVKVLHNEKEQPILGLEPLSGPYYRWSEVRAMLMRYLEDKTN